MTNPLTTSQNLSRKTAAIDWMMHCWPLPSAPYKFFTSPPLVLSPTSTPATPQAPTTAPPYPDTSHTAISPNSSEHLSTATTNDPNDHTLLAAAMALDNFLLQHPCKLNLPDNIPCYQPSLDQRPLLCRHTLFTKQTVVLCTMNMLLAELCKQVSLFSEASTNLPFSTCLSHSTCILSTPTILLSPPQSSLTNPTKSILHLLPFPQPPHNPAICISQFLAHKTIIYQTSIPATHHVTCAYHKPMQHQTKDCLCPP